MSNDPSNPYQSPSGESYESTPEMTGDPVAPRESIDYFGPFSQFFSHEQWVTNLLLPSLVLLIPIVGAMVVWGYCYEIMAQLLTGRTERPYQTFTFDRFGEYLMRGLWVMLALFLLGMIFTIPLMFIIGVLQFTAQQVGGTAGAMILATSFFVQIGAQIVINLLTIPAAIRVGLTKDFAQAFDFGFMLDFFKRMWLDQLLVVIFVAFAASIVGGAGMLACCIGILPAMVLMMFVVTIFNMQLYQVYLFRGGQPIAIVL